MHARELQLAIQLAAFTFAPLAGWVGSRLLRLLGAWIAAKRLGLTLHPGLREVRLVGRIEGCSVELRLDDKRRVRGTIRHPSLPRDFGFEARHQNSGAPRLGDYWFDWYVAVDGTRRSALATLDPATRSVVAAAVSERWTLASGDLDLNQSTGLLLRRASLVRRVRAGLRAADVLGRAHPETSRRAPGGAAPTSTSQNHSVEPAGSTAEPWNADLGTSRSGSLGPVSGWALGRAHPGSARDTEQALVVRASEDPQAELRWNALESLASLPPRSSEGRACVEEALAGDDPARRAVVAMARGDDPELAVLRGVLLEPSTPTAMRERVVDWISTRWWQGGVAAAAEPALVVALLTMPRGAARADGLALVLNGPSRGNPDWESALVPVLGDERVEVVVDACQALGACGGRPAVRALSLRTRRGEPRAVRRAAKRATLAIRARLGPANAGHLSVASAAPGGELTLETAGGEGGLSL